MDTALAKVVSAGAVRNDLTRVVFASADASPVEWTVGELHRAARIVAARWSGLGIGRGDVVAIQAPNRPETAVAYLATVLLHATLLPIVTIYGTAELSFILSQSAAKALIVPRQWRGVDYQHRVRGLSGVASLERVIWLDDVLGEWSSPGGRRLPDEARPVSKDAGGCALLVYTSGTTGVPKGVWHTARSVAAELRDGPTPPQGIPRVVSLQPFPAGHTAGVSALLGPSIHGVDTVVMDHWDVEVAAHLVEQYGVNALAGTPFHIMGLLDIFEDASPPVVIPHVVTGGAGVPVSMVERADDLGWRVSRCYGSTELPSATGTPADAPLDLRSKTDGRPLGRNEVRVVGPTGRPLGPSEEGEIQLRGPEQFAGYVDEELTSEIDAGEGWFRTGDIGVLDVDGYLTVTDRLKDIIIRGGENISSVEVEDVLRRHPAVEDVAVVASPDDRYGERVCAYVTMRPEQDLTLDDVRRHFAQSAVARQKTPERLEIVADFPRTPAGKIQKSELRRRLRGEEAETS